MLPEAARLAGAARLVRCRLGSFVVAPTPMRFAICAQAFAERGNSGQVRPYRRISTVEHDAYALRSSDRLI
jgi:hypothetical protein